MRHFRSARLIVASVAAAVIILDQVSKTWAQRDLASHSLKIIGPISFQLFYNSGAAFSIGTGNALFVTIVELAVLVGIIIYVRRVKSRVLALGFGLVIGGALGNIADRVFRHNHGSVIDFIHATSFWPTFNLADSAVVIGIVVILLGSRSKRKQLI